MIEFRHIDTRTEKGLLEAEELKEEGWVLGPVGFWTLQFSRDVPGKVLRPTDPDYMETYKKRKETLTARKR